MLSAIDLLALPKDLLIDEIHVCCGQTLLFVQGHYCLQYAYEQ